MDLPIEALMVLSLARRTKLKLDLQVEMISHYALNRNKICNVFVLQAFCRKCLNTYL